MARTLESIRRGARKPPAPAEFSPVPPLDLALLHDLPSLELRARFIMDGFLAGLHRSPRKGSSVEFAEYRNYQFGDDLRRIDWRLYGRTDRLHLKQTEHETQLRLNLVLDTSASMAFTSRPGRCLKKIDFARTLLASLGLLALRQGDAFGLASVGDNLGDYLKPKTSQSHWRIALGKLDAVKTGGGTGLVQGLKELAEIIPARSLIVIASDFYGNQAELSEALRRLRFDHHEVMALQILDPAETEFDQEWNGTLVDAETGQKMILDASAVRTGYLERVRKFLSQIESMILDEGGDHALVRTDASPNHALGLYLAERSRLL